jgi:isoleucyl-tRNA synthetase
MYNAKEIESKILDFWKKRKIYSKLKSKLKNKKKKFYFLDGPPYTTGKIHVGHAWNYSLKDCFRRYKRMNAVDIWDQPGFDMHGLPIEVNVEKKLNIKNKKELIEKIGLSKFIRECEKFAVDNMKPMINDFNRIGIWMDWKNPYMTIKNGYIEGAWWALKEAYKNGYLYQGKKVLTWCPRCATALAKHELNYKSVKDNSIFVKFPVKDKEQEYLLVWTTTPWTLAFNLAVMVNPELDYVKAKVGDEIWIIAKALAGPVIKAVANKKFEIIEEFKGKELEGLKYKHPFLEEIKYHKNLKEKYNNSILLSEEYVNLSSGTGLVHCAPGCGPEDFEVGKRYGLPAYNSIDENGIFDKTMGKFSGLRARQDDVKFIQALKEKGLLLAEASVEHEYAHCWRCENGVIFRATEQWFLAVEKVKEKMRKFNEKIYWVPGWAGNKWFDSWLKDLQDWCISRQRFWGIPLPIWMCGKCKKYELIESADELKKRSRKSIKNLHRPWVDEVSFKCKCGGLMKRVPDVLDVWLDSGASPWATLGWPKEKKLLKELWPADLILEGKDQIRGWFNSLFCLSMVSFKEASYEGVYMHGMILDTQGRKMSKSLGNIIVPYEVIDKYGADTMRFYMITGANPGLDLNYNFDDMKIKHRNLNILWNLYKYIINYSSGMRFTSKLNNNLSVEEKYILSKMNRTIKQVTELFENVVLNEPGLLIEDLLLELSRTYVQLVREKLSVGDDKEKKIILSTIYNVFLNILKLLAPITPFITEEIYQNLKKNFNLKEESIHFCKWPEFDKKMIDEKLENDMEVVKEINSLVLYEREKIKINVRWPLQKLTIFSEDENVLKSVKRLKEIIRVQCNVKDIVLNKIGKSAKVKGVEFKGGVFVLDTKLNPELEVEGYCRELIRRVQALRKKANLNREKKIELYINSDYHLDAFRREIMEKVSAKKLEFNQKKKLKFNDKFVVKDYSFEIGFNVL